MLYNQINYRKIIRAQAENLYQKTMSMKKLIIKMISKVHQKIKNKL